MFRGHPQFYSAGVRGSSKSWVMFETQRPLRFVLFGCEIYETPPDCPFFLNAENAEDAALKTENLDIRARVLGDRPRKTH